MGEEGVTEPSVATTVSAGLALAVSTLASNVVKDLSGAENATGTPPEFNSSFLQHASGKGISGIFAWGAILVTSHQVRKKVKKMIVS